MDSPPDCVDAEYAWLFPGGDGTGVQICDCEYGFNQTHEDLPNIAVISNLGGNLAQYEDHGTAVLGILVGVHDQKGINGIAHGVTMNFASESNGHRLDCINDAIAALNVGDILILEMQTTGALGGYVPAEYDSDIHAALLTATGNGMVVIAAAGNGSQNLNIYTNDQGLKIWDKNSPDWNDSGSIIVGAGHSNANAIPHSKCGFSTYGDRVNCHGWGEDVVTTGYGYLYDGGHNEMYTDVFGGTSSATPIVAGVAACLQGAAIQALGIPLSPSQIRAILSDVNNGTPQADSVQYPVAAYNIGPMPNLRATLHAAGIQADVFMRDNVADTGVTPYPGNILCWSPDLIARQNMVAQPDIEFGIAHWSEADLGQNIKRSQNNYIYVRMYNRGNVPDDVSVSVYWTDSGGFLHPNSWKPIGTLTVNNVAPGEHRVAGHVTWLQNDIPAAGHYCLIAVVNSNRDPIDIPSSFTSSADYMDFVRNHNNICYRNTTVEEAAPDAPAPPFVFKLMALPDKTGYHSLQLRSHMPKNAKIEVKIQKRILRYEKYEIKKAKLKTIRYLAPNTIFQIKEQKPLQIEEILLKKGESAEVAVNIKLPRDIPAGSYLIHADQYFEGKQIGRVNYVLRVKRHITK